MRHLLNQTKFDYEHRIVEITISSLFRPNPNLNRFDVLDLTEFVQLEIFDLNFQCRSLLLPNHLIHRVRIVDSRIKEFTPFSCKELLISSSTSSIDSSGCSLFAFAALD